jgi:hypothetical protein
VRHSGRRGQLQDVIVGPLTRIAERERVVEENPRGAVADRNQIIERNSRERGPGLCLTAGPEVSPDETGVGLADLDERLARPVVRDANDIEALIRNAVPKQR